MSFVYFFDLVDFDAKGNVCETKRFDKNHARANYLYLISKYNQQFLADKKMEIPAFFKTDLNVVLLATENGVDFKKAKQMVLANCTPEVQYWALKTKTDRDFIQALNTNVSIKDKAFAKNFSDNMNNLHLAYVITAISGNIQMAITKILTEEKALSDAKTKSLVFKDIIKYNALVDTAEKVQSNQLTTSDVKLKIA